MQGENMSEKIFIPYDMKLLDPKIDSTFKTLFTRSAPGSETALKGLVKAVTGYEPEEITILNSELPKDIAHAKDIRLDLSCRMKDGSLIDIEMQTFIGNDNLRLRSLYYGCRMVSSAEMKGHYYRRLPRVYQVMFTNFRLFEENDDFIQSFRMQNGDIELTDRLQIIFIQMPLVEIGEREIKNLSELEKWVIFLRDGTDRTKRDILNSIMESSPEIMNTGGILMNISKDLKEWAIQESRIKGELDYQSGLLASYDTGLEKGLEQAARGMKTENIPSETISKITGLTQEQIAAL